MNGDKLRETKSDKYSEQKSKQSVNQTQRSCTEADDDCAGILYLKFQRRLATETKVMIKPIANRYKAPL